MGSTTIALIRPVVALRMRQGRDLQPARSVQSRSGVVPGRVRAVTWSDERNPSA
jgi:hypothetical protein